MPIWPRSIVASRLELARLERLHMQQIRSEGRSYTSRWAKQALAEARQMLRRTQPLPA